MSVPNLINNPLEIGTVGATAGVSMAHWLGLVNDIGGSIGILLTIVLSVVVIRKNLYEHKLKIEAEKRRKGGEK
jgi:hypothetical protein